MSSLQLEERKMIESQNKSMITDELERARMDVETEKIEIQSRVAGGKKYGPKEAAELEIQIAEMKADKSVVTMQVRKDTSGYYDSINLHWILCLHRTYQSLMLNCICFTSVTQKPHHQTYKCILISTDICFWSLCWRKL